MIASFIAGMLVGAGRHFCFALWWVRSKPEAQPMTPTISALGVGGHAVTVESVNADLLKRVFRQLEKGRA